MQPNNSSIQNISSQQRPDQQQPDQEDSAQEQPDQQQPDQERPDQEQPDQANTASSDPISGLTPVEILQKRYADQLSHDIEQLETQKTQLREDIQTLARAYTRLQASVESLRHAERSANKAADAANKRMTEAIHADAIERETALAAESSSQAAQFPETQFPETHFSNTQTSNTQTSEFVKLSIVPSPPRPAEDTTETTEALPPTEQTTEPQRSIELPLPATSVQRRQISIQSRRVERINSVAIERKGLFLSAIATVLMAWHFCVVATLGTGGSWLGITIGTLGVGFMPAVALLWLRMLVVVPALVLLAPQLHEEVWEDLQEWTYNRDGLLLLLIGSGIALFTSQVLLYQCLGLLGPAIGAALLFLYPLTAVPFNAIFGVVVDGYRRLSALGAVALVAIAMGGVLTLKPTVQSTLNTPSTIWLGLGASIAFSLYIALTNISYRQPKCHPIPAGLVQFCVVAVLSSIVLLVKPLEPAAIDWLSFALWGILLGFLMLLVYLFNYTSLRLIGPRTAIIAAIAPLATLILAWSFTPTPTLAIIQWTGIALVSIGGIALGKEKLGN
ncbi:MAG: DMT family transporter [Phormidesmis sp.]